jgi:hypothetical protein
MFDPDYDPNNQNITEIYFASVQNFDSNPLRFSKEFVKQ